MTRILVDRTSRTHQAWRRRSATVAGAFAALALAGCIDDAATAESGAPSEPGEDTDDDAADLAHPDDGATGVVQLLGTFDVGVIPGAGEVCPAGSDEVIIRMDDEDTGNTSSRNGWVGKTNANEGQANTRLYFCRVDGTLFRPFSTIADLGNMRDDYAVLKLGTACPPGSVQFSRFFDNEDTSNTNFFAGNIAPNVSAANTRLFFCAFRAAQLNDPTINEFPILGPGFSYGVFGPEDFEHTPDLLAHPIGTIRTDDEDTNNGNTYTVPMPAEVAAQRIIDPEPDATLLRVVRAR